MPTKAKAFPTAAGTTSTKVSTRPAFPARPLVTNATGQGFSRCEASKPVAQSSPRLLTPTMIASASEKCLPLSSSIARGSTWAGRGRSSLGWTPPGCRSAAITSASSGVPTRRTLWPLSAAGTAMAEPITPAPRIMIRPIGYNRLPLGASNTCIFAGSIEKRTISPLGITGRPETTARRSSPPH
jgi:hypothetical protein